MTVGDELRDWLPAGIDKNCPEVAALFAGEDGRGAIADAVNGLLEFCDYHTRNGDVSGHGGETLDMAADLFAGLERKQAESDGHLLRRLKAWCERKGDRIWGSARDIERVAEIYFGRLRCYACEGVDEAGKSLVSDGDFENDGGAAWSFSGGAERTAEARFSGRWGASLQGGSVSQTIFLEQGNYVLHFFHSGAVSVRVSDGGGRFFDAREWVSDAEWRDGLRPLEWRENPSQKDFRDEGEWAGGEVLIAADREMEATVELFGAGSVDYVRLWKKPPHPSFSLVLWFVGYTANDRTLHLSEGSEDDPRSMLPYLRSASHYDRSFLTGLEGRRALAEFEKFFNEVKPVGVQFFLELLEKEEV